MYGKYLGLGLILAAYLLVGQAQGEPYAWTWGPQSVSAEYGTVNGGERTRSDYQSDASAPSTDWTVYLSKTAEKDINTSFSVLLEANYQPGWILGAPTDQFSISPMANVFNVPVDSRTYYGAGEVRFELRIDPNEKIQYNVNVAGLYPSNAISQEIAFKTEGGSNLGLNGLLSEPGILSGWLKFDLTSDSIAGQSAQAMPTITLDLTPSGIPLVPEPTQLSLLGSGALGLAAFGLRRWRRRGAKRS